jgi:hypothetical protein
MTPDLFPCELAARQLAEIVMRAARSKSGHNDDSNFHCGKATLFFSFEREEMVRESLLSLTYGSWADTHARERQNVRQARTAPPV